LLVGGVRVLALMPLERHRRRPQRLVAEGEVRRLLGNHHQVIQWVEVASVSLPERAYSAMVA